MTPQYVTVDYAGNIYPISNLRDQFQNPTLDPALAETCIIHLSSRQMVASTTDEIPVYTVH